MNETGKKVTKRAGIVSAGTLLSRILGLVRESVIAAWFPKEAIDAYQIAFMLPNSFRRLTAEGSFSISVTTVFSKIWQNNDIERSREFASRVYGFSILFLAFLTIAGVFGAKWLTLIAGPGFADNPEKFQLAINLTGVMFPYIFFISLTALAMGLLNSAGKFFAPAFAPVLLNISIIGAAVGLTGFMPQLGLNPIFALAAGIIIGGIAQLAIQLPSLKGVNLLVMPTLNFKDKGLLRVLKLTGPMIIGASAYQLFVIMSSAFASTLGDGAVTYIAFAQRLFELPLAVLVMAISTAALPSLAGMIGQNRETDAVAIWSQALKLALFVSTPAMAAMIVLAEPIITVMYQRGLFNHHDVLETAGALRWLAAGTVSVALLRQTTPFFYALEKVKIPVIMTFVMIISYGVAAMLLKDRFKAQGLCMAVTIAATIQGTALFIALKKEVKSLHILPVIKSWLKMAAAAIPMSVAIWAIALLGKWQDGGNSILNIFILLLCVATGVIAYAGASYILQIEEMKELFNAVKKRGKK
ncbi:MAG: murein biosynthesis integral membrane protein MurJ [Deltaproteobacteria bacterium]|nr:murein biosynthesis integral membrane protein MurJ [Deltaproteobacteria bacterium]